MPLVRDFRNYHFDLRRIERCGRFLGRNSYGKLYAAENVLRLIIHSVLSAQINSAWWNVAVDRNIMERANKTRARYAKHPLHTPPGKHDLYLVLLTDLNNIIRANSNLFRPLIPDIDQWIAKIEGIVLPRNLVGHMNFPHQADRQRIEMLHKDLTKLLAGLQSSGLKIFVP